MGPEVRGCFLSVWLPFAIVYVGGLLTFLYDVACMANLLLSLIGCTGTRTMGLDWGDAWNHCFFLSAGTRFALDCAPPRRCAIVQYMVALGGL